MFFSMQISWNDDHQQKWLGRHKRGRQAIEIGMQYFLDCFIQMCVMRLDKVLQQAAISRRAEHCCQSESASYLSLKSYHGELNVGICTGNLKSWKSQALPLWKSLLAGAVINHLLQPLLLPCILSQKNLNSVTRSRAKSRIRAQSLEVFLS